MRHSPYHNHSEIPGFLGPRGVSTVAAPDANGNSVEAAAKGRPTLRLKIG